MIKRIVVLNGIGTTSQTFGIFGGTLEDAKKKFLAICKKAKVEPIEVHEEEDKIVISFAELDEDNWNILQAVTNETECGGDPPNQYVLEEFAVNEGDYCKTGAFND